MANRKLSPQEQKARFRRDAEHRMSMLLRNLGMLEEIADRDRGLYTEEQVIRMLTAIDETTKRVKLRFNKGLKKQAKREPFSF